MLLNNVHDRFYPDCDVFYPLTKIREAEVTLITPERIKIVRLREELVFEASVSGLYTSLDGKKVTANDTGVSRLLFDFSFAFKTQILTEDSLHKCNTKIPFLSIGFQNSISPTLASLLCLHLIPS